MTAVPSNYLEAVAYYAELREREQQQTTEVVENESGQLGLFGESPHGSDLQSAAGRAPRDSDR